MIESMMTDEYSREAMSVMDYNIYDCPVAPDDPGKPDTARCSDGK